MLAVEAESVSNKYTPANNLVIAGENSDLFTTIYPKPAAETILLLHGGPGVPMDFSAIAEPLSKKYQIITFDQRGTGRSPASNATYSISEYVLDINTVLKYFNINVVHLFGHSWGGLYAQIYAELYPDRILSMFLCSPSSGTGSLWVQTEKEIMTFNKKYAGTLDWMMMGICSLLGMLGSDKSYQCLFKQVLDNYNKDFDPTFVATDSMVNNVRADPINKTRSNIVKYRELAINPDYSFPVIVTYGQKDIYGPSKESVKTRLPGAKFIEIKNAGHIAWRQNEPDFDRVLSDFYRLHLI